MKIVKKIRRKKDFDSDDFVKNPEFLKLKLLYDKLKAKYPEKNIFNILEKKIFIPSSIFNKKLSSLETITKYLVENCSLSLNKIAKLTNRTNKNIWYAYNSSKRKLSAKFTIKEFGISIPVSIISNLRLSVLENIVVYLKEKFELSYHEIGAMLKRDEKTIWCVYDKAKKKRGGG